MLGQNRRMEDRYSCHFEDPQCLINLQKVIYSQLMDFNAAFSRNIVYLCIGTDRATGDCLGPLVGSRLQTYMPDAMVYGTLQQPVHAVNLEQIMETLPGKQENPLIVAIDACLGNVDRIGFVNVRRGSLKPGSAMNKELPEVGDFHISGVVNVGGYFEHMVLQNTRLFTVYKMADIIAKGIYLAQYRFHRQGDHFMI